MQLNKKYGQVKFGVVAMLTFQLVACGNSADSSDATNSDANSVAGQTYEVVTVTQPENFSQYRDWYKTIYESCVELAKARNLPVKPFVNVPVDFIIDKDVYISDGKNYLHSNFSYGININDDVPEKGCGTSIVKTESHLIIKNGKSYAVDVQENGERVGPQFQVDMVQEPAEDTSLYSVPKVVNGIPLKCQASSEFNKALGEFCILEPKGITKFIQIDGKFLPAYARNFLTKDQFGVLVTKPVSVKANVPINSTVFDVK
ncbi:hypothetical protein H8K32_07810 [Undibacterium jejuense]|uniref:Uncharacterized protein n=1 Tax=Undibacterium jejuense TaxID=1344949 RepID=A0A923HCI2_9BURK|nr:hypothetical protein [Undibacterium jejuense]MBC3861997.1 hypothetical protein [Undibacterium jejuense]